MTRKTRRADGSWDTGKAGPELLRPALRELPSALVTKDEADPDRIHDLDAPHIVQALTEEHAKKISDTQTPLDKTGKLPNGPLAKVGERKRLSQREVDWVRIRVQSVLLSNAHRAAAAGEEPDMSVWHLWFPTDEVNIYSLRPGNPPSHYDTPKHMRGLRLWVDPKKIDDSMAALAAEVDIDIGYDLSEIWTNLHGAPKRDYIVTL